MPFQRGRFGKIVTGFPGETGGALPAGFSCGCTGSAEPVCVALDGPRIVKAVVSPCCACRQVIREGDRVRLVRSGGVFVVVGVQAPRNEADQRRCPC